MTDNTSQIPDWAIERARELGGKMVLSHSFWSADHIRAQVGEAWADITLAFAAYIAAHEEAPVDPLLIEAREIARRHAANSSALITSFNQGYGADVALEALRRGIELGERGQ